MIRSILLLILWTLTLTLATTNKCTYIEYRGQKVREENFKCPQTRTCKKSITISIIDLPPYSTSRIFERILRRCCGPCTNISFVKTYTNITEVRLARGNSPDFLLPFLGRATKAKLYSYHFIPFIDVPYAYYISPKHKSRATYFISSCFELYPFVAIYLLLAIISGFIVWALEARNNQEHFPRPFIAGVFEGFWFSFVSMTAVGYGDKLPRSVCAKLYSIVWILAGIIMFGFLTSQFTAELMMAMQPRDDSMTGANVGVLKYRDYDASVVVGEGGVVKETNGKDFYSDIQKLIRMLRKGEIKGIILDKYTVTYINGYLHWLKNDTLSRRKNSRSKTNETDKELSEDIDFYLTATHRTLKAYRNHELAYGVLVNDSHDYDYLNSAVRDNRFSLELQIDSEVNQEFPVELLGLSKRLSSYFDNVFKVLGATIGLICILGIGYEVYIRKRRLPDEGKEKHGLKTREFVHMGIIQHGTLMKKQDAEWRKKISAQTPIFLDAISQIQTL